MTEISYGELTSSIWTYVQGHPLESAAYLLLAGLVTYTAIGMQRYFMPGKKMKPAERKAFWANQALPNMAVVAGVVFMITLERLHPGHELFSLMGQLKTAEQNPFYAFGLGVLAAGLYFILRQTQVHLAQTACIFGLAMLTLPSLNPLWWLESSMLAGAVGKSLGIGFGIPAINYWLDKKRPQKVSPQRAPRATKTTSTSAGNVVNLRGTRRANPKK